ncbi:MAG TPA: hypothetical protein VMZ90_03840 [Vicinamibacterales bacterium]|nr:hypothetical protein [Vicinamibacterales bacterium]
MTHQARTLTAAEEMRLCLGFVVQPFVGAVVAFVLFRFLLLDRAGRTFAGDYASDTTAAAVSVASGTFIASVVILAGVVPTAVWVLKRRALSFTRALLWGAGFGSLPIVIGTVLGGSYGLMPFVRSAVFAALVGITGAAVFWMISVRGRDFSHDPD